MKADFAKVGVPLDAVAALFDCVSAKPRPPQRSARAAVRWAPGRRPV